MLLQPDPQVLTEYPLIYAQINMLGNKKKNAAVPTGPKYDARYKVIVLGESTVGKTSLIHAAMGEKFNPTLISTIGVDYAKRLFDIEGYTIQLELWDTAGQERYRSLCKLHYRDAKGFIVVYDITNRDSFTRIRRDWIPDIDQNLNEQAPVFFVGNKSDLEASRQVTLAEGEKVCFSIQILVASSVARLPTMCSVAHRNKCKDRKQYRKIVLYNCGINDFLFWRSESEYCNLAMLRFDLHSLIILIFQQRDIINLKITRKARK
ncbi:hypothetical protein Ciccas_013247 [Cichlidogyrus casuarinus]|uniref:Uncharacterized protein n=1 Tax=Cichlidogyrus casuarinus TaxID=1844966 RepID=A0ABD2PL29_9PLAT